MNFIGIIIAILIFGFLIAIHELGHFLAARICNVKVNEFSIGMGPKLFSKRKGETLYSLRALPFGGFCAMEGEDEDNQDERALNNKSVGARLLIMSAGAIFNLILGLIIVFVMMIIQPLFLSTQISYFSPDASSQKSGLEIGDYVKNVDGMSILTVDELGYAITRNNSGIYDMIVERDGEKVKLDGVALQKDNLGKPIVDFRISAIEKTASGIFINTFKQTLSFGRIIWISLGDLLTGRFGMEAVSGPVGIVSAIGQSVSEQVEDNRTVQDISLNLLNIFAMITINLGIMNLLPLPALDGGRIFFLIIEAIRRKPIKREREGLIHFIGFVILLGFIIFITFKDIINLF